MTKERICGECGATLASDVADAFCPACLLEGSLRAGRHSEAACGKSTGFGDYELIEKVARGGMGIVYKAKQKSLERIVAVKMLLFGPQAGPDMIRRFRVEAVAAGSLHHPNIVGIHEVGIHDGRHFIVMDYVDGANLAKIGREQPLSPRQIAEYAKAIAHAIHYAHQEGILHRDLKPSNVLVDANGQVRITDFGLARQMEGDSSLTLSGQVIGSPNYMPPEQAAGCGKRGRVGRWNDVYGVGAILYYLLTGRPPFQGENVADALYQVIHCEPIAVRLLNPNIPRDLETICMKCLEKEPARRYQTARELADDLDRWLRLEPIQAHPAGPLLRATRWTRRNPVGAALILTLFFGLVSSLVAFKLIMAHSRAASQARLAAERARAMIFEQIGVSGFWDRPDASARVPAEILSLASGREEVSASSYADATRYSFGIVIEEEDVAGLALRYAPLLAYVEESLSRIQTNLVRLELILFKRNEEALLGLADGKVDILKIGGNSCLQAMTLNPDLCLLVSQHPAKRGVIFARKDSGLTCLEQVLNHSVAFGERQSTISAWAAYYLTEAGISGTNLSRYEFLDPVSQFERNPLGRAVHVKLTGHILSMKAVATNGFDVGVASESQFLKAADPPALVALKTFPSDPVYWVARKGFPAVFAAQLTTALVQLKDENLLKSGSRRLNQYLPASKEELDNLRKATAIVAAHFEGRKMKKSTRAAFTLIELLVVIAIIGIMAGLLLPALARSKRKGQQTGCLNKMRQWTLAALSYTDDNNDLLPREKCVPDIHTWDDVSSPLHLEVWFNALARDYFRQRGVYSFLNDPAAFHSQGNIFQCPTVQFPAGDGPTFSIAFNSKLSQSTDVFQRVRFGSIQHYSSTVLFLDCGVTNEPPLHPKQKPYYGQPSAWANRLSGRHNRGANLGFTDGHVQWFPGSKVVDPSTGNGFPAPSEVLWTIESK